MNKFLINIILILVLSCLIKCQPYSATQSQPLDMQTKKVDLYMTTTTNINAATFTFPYDNALSLSVSGTYNPIGLISMSSLDFIPAGTQNFRCASQTVGIISLTIICYINSVTTINKLSYYYIVFGSSIYLETYYGAPYICLSAKEFEISSYNFVSGNNYYVGVSHNLKSNTYLRSYIFIRGIEHGLASSTFNMNITNAAGLITITLPNGISIGPSGISKIYLSMLIFDPSIMFITKSFSILDSLSEYQLGTQITNIYSGIDLTKYWMLIGLKSVSFNDVMSLSFQFSYDSADITFPGDSPYNQVQYVWITQLTCNPGSYLERAQKLCKTERNGCTNYYEYITGASILQITGVYLHSSRKIFAVCSSYEVRIYRHNSANFIFYTSFYIPIQTSKIIKIQFSPDMSRVAVLCSTCGFFIYKWNGASYIPEYVLPTTSSITSLTFLDFSIKEDFKMITILSIQNYIKKRVTLIYNNTMRNYSIGASMELTYAGQIHINYVKGQAYFVGDRFIDHMTYDPNIISYGPYSPRLQIYQPLQSITSAISGNKKVIALDYTHNSSLSNSSGIKIYQYDENQRIFVYHSKLKQIQNQNFGIQNYLKLSNDGLKLLIKGVANTVENRLIFTRTSISNEFVLNQIIGSNVELVQQSIYPTTLGFIDASDNFDMILSVDGKYNVVLYYCQSVIANIANLYSIPIASPLYTQIISQSQKIINNLTSQIEVLNTTINNMSGSSNIMMFFIYGILSTLVIILAILIFKLYKIFQQNPNLQIQSKQSLNNKTIQTLQDIKIVQNSQITINEKSNNNNKSTVPQKVPKSKDQTIKKQSYKNIYRNNKVRNQDILRINDRYKNQDHDELDL